MLKDIVEARPLEEYRLQVVFEDGVKGEVDLGNLIRFEGIFAPLKDRAYFKQLYVSSELGVICWPNGADLDPDVLYSLITGAPISLEAKVGA